MPGVLGIIPARYGSTRFPGKPLALIFGKPMIVHTYLNSCKAKLLDDVIVATDNEEIADTVTKTGGKAILTPSDLKSGSDRAAYVIERYPCDIAGNIQGDEPFISGKAIDAAVEPLLTDSAVQVSTLVKKIENPELLNDPNTVKVIKDKNGFALYFSRSMIPYNRNNELPLDSIKRNIFFKHIGLYVYRSDFLKKFVGLPFSGLEDCEKLEQLRILENGYRIKCVETDYESISVDTIEDLNKIEKINIDR